MIGGAAFLLQHIATEMLAIQFLQLGFTISEIY